MPYDIVEVDTGGKIRHTVYRYSNFTCDNCDTPFEPVDPDWVNEDGHWLILQPLDGVRLTSEGFYGGFWDDSATVWFCKNCVEKLILAFPVFNVMIEPDEIEVTTADYVLEEFVREAKD